MDWAAISGVAAAAGIGFGAAEGFVRFARRPRLTLTVDEDRVHSRVEGDGWPYIRILASNGRFCRSARHARVLVESYHAQGQTLSERITLGSPSLGWTSGGSETKADGSLTIPPGVSRALDIGYLTTKAVNQHAQRLPPSMANPWGLQLGLHELRLTDGRDWLPCGRWIIRLVASADDAATQTYDLKIEWSPAQMVEYVLDSVAASIVNSDARRAAPSRPALPTACLCGAANRC